MERDKEARQDSKEPRDRLHDLVKRAKRDPALLEQIKNDPLTVLQQEGVSEEAAGDFLREEGFAKLDPASGRLTAGQRRAHDVSVARSCWFTCTCR